MRTTVLFICLIFSTYAHAAKPVDPEPEPSEPVFVGYAGNLSPPVSAAYSVWITGIQSCVDVYGEGATMATSEQVRAALDDGTFFFPDLDTYAMFSPSTTNMVGGSDYIYDPYLNLRLLNTGSFPAAVASSLAKVFTPFESLSSTSPYGLTFGCAK